MESPRPDGAGALILAEEQRLASFVGMHYPQLRKVSTKGARIYGTTYNEGMEAGRQLTLNEGVTGQQPVFGGLLGR